MCNLYRLSKGPAETAKLFAAQADPPGNAGEMVYPGYPGLVVAEGRVRQMIAADACPVTVVRRWLKFQREPSFQLKANRLKFALLEKRKRTDSERWAHVVVAGDHFDPRTGRHISTFDHFDTEPTCAAVCLTQWRAPTIVMNGHFHRWSGCVSTLMLVGCLGLTSGCGSLRDGGSWGRDALYPVQWKRIPQAAKKALLDPGTWLPGMAADAARAGR